MMLVHYYYYYYYYSHFIDVEMGHNSEITWQVYTAKLGISSWGECNRFNKMEHTIVIVIFRNTVQFLTLLQSIEEELLYSPSFPMLENI